MLKGKIAIVTGSTSGIGLGIARALAGAGADVMLNGFGEASAIETLRAGLAEEFGVRAGYHGADLSKPEEIADLVATAANRLGAVDILVNNAGIQHVAPVEEFPAERWDAVIAEVELSHPEQLVPLPDWVGAEVTHRAAYSNSALSRTPIRRWVSAA